MGSFEILDFDTMHFGICIARLTTDRPKDVADALSSARKAGIRLLIARCASTNLQMVHALEVSGARLMDTIVSYRAVLSKMSPVDYSPEITVRRSNVQDLDSIARIARNSFHRYFGHFHSDPMLDPSRCDDLYVSWAVNSSVESGLADTILVAEYGNELAGFITMRKDPTSNGRGVLNAVDPSVQGKGVYRSLVSAAMKWCQSEQLERMIIGTQINNYAVQKTWIRLGFEVYDSSYTFHKWLSTGQCSR